MGRSDSEWPPPATPDEDAFEHIQEGQKPSTLLGGGQRPLDESEEQDD